MGAEPVFDGRRVERQTRAVLTSDIAAQLGLPAPTISEGSSADSTFLDRIWQARTGGDPVEGNAYRKVEAVLKNLGLTYDPFWDTSESSDTGGGSTVTNRGYSRIRTALTGVPRCFLVRGFPLPEGHVQFDSGSEGRATLIDAGPASRVLLWNQPREGQTRLNAHGEVAYVQSNWTAPWLIEFVELRRLESPVSFSSVGLTGRMPVVTEINHETYQALLRGTHNSRLDQNTTEESDPGGDVVAERVLTEIPLPSVAPFLDVPNDLPGGKLDVTPAIAPVYTEAADSGLITSSDLPPAPRDRKKAKAAEERAVKLACQALEAQGWTLKKDCQKDGVGYDLVYTQGVRQLHVEVKGIMSTTLAFNLTPKESWRVETDSDFVVIAVTNVLSPTAFKLHLLDRTRIASAPRVVTGYRLKF